MKEIHYAIINLYYQTHFDELFLINVGLPMNSSALDSLFPPLF